MRVLHVCAERLSETTAVTAFLFLPPRRLLRLFFRRSAVYCTAFTFRQLIVTMKQGRRHRPGYGCIAKSHGPLSVCKDTPLFPRPCPPLGRLCQAGPVLSFVAAIPHSLPAPARGHVVPAKAHGNQPQPSCPAPSCSPCSCCRCRLHLLLLRRRRCGWRRWCQRFAAVAAAARQSRRPGCVEMGLSQRRPRHE